VLGYDFGFDALHFHELAHEWWGNMLTASDWRDLWLHEGFATYMEALYAEYLKGAQAYRQIIDFFKERCENIYPLAPVESKTAQEIYGNDSYYKGACVLHMLRYYLGDSLFFQTLRHWAFPDSTYFYARPGRQCRIVSSEDFQSFVEKESGQNMNWFFQTYLRQADLPILHAFIGTTELQLNWEVQNPYGFYMPVEIKIRSEKFLIDMAAGSAIVPLDRLMRPVIDPEYKLFAVIQKTTRIHEQDVEKPYR
jgi:aminopeptidase N